MPSFLWKREDEELLLEACKQEHIAHLVGRRTKKNLHIAIAAYMNENKVGLNLKLEQIKNKLETFEKLWEAYHMPKKARRCDFMIIDKYLDQFMLLFGVVSPSDSLPTMSCQSGGVSRQTLESSASSNNLEAALRYLYHHGCRGHQFFNYKLLLKEYPNFLVGFFVLPTYEERISYLDYLEYLQNKNNNK